MESTPTPQNAEHQGNGKKPLRVLVFGDDSRLNYLLESRFAANRYRVTVIDDLHNLDRYRLSNHDIFILGGSFPQNVYAPMPTEEQSLLIDIQESKRKKNKPYVAVVPLQQRDDYQFTRHQSNAGVDASKFDEAMNIVYDVFRAYRLLCENKPVDLTAGFIHSIDDIVREDGPQQNIPLEMLRRQIEAHPDKPEFLIALAEGYEARNQPLDALRNYQVALHKNPSERDRVIHAIGRIILNPQMTRRLEHGEIFDLLRLIDTATTQTVDIDHYKNALYLGLGDEESLRSVIALCQRHESTPEFARFYPALLDAHAKVTLATKSPEDKEQLCYAIEKFVKATGDVEYTTDGADVVGIRLVKMHMGRHTVHASAPTMRQGHFQSEHHFIKAFTPEQEKSALIEEANILTLNERHAGRIKTPYAELSIPPSTVLAHLHASDERPVYLVTPLLDGVRADRFLEEIAARIPDADAADRLKQLYLQRIMDCGIALQLSMKRAKRTIPQRKDFYASRFVEKVLGRLGILNSRLTQGEINGARAFVISELNNPLIQGDSKLNLPYTGSHTLKNILIKRSEMPSLNLEDEVAKSAIARCDLEDASNRFFASDHALSIEDSAIGITDKRKLKMFYDRLLLRFLTARSIVDAETRALVDGDPAQRARLIKRLLCKQGINCTYEQYHDLVARTSLERHMTFAFDRIKEIAIKKLQIAKLEAPVDGSDTMHEALKGYGAYLKNIRSFNRQHPPLNYDAVLDRLLKQRHELRDESWTKLFIYFSLQRDYDAVRNSKDYHVARVRSRMRELWWKQSRDEGYRAFKKAIDLAAAYQ